MTDDGLAERVLRRLREMTTVVNHPFVTSDEDRADITRLRLACAEVALRSRGFIPPHRD